jgi:hypothetical protein
MADIAAVNHVLITGKDETAAAWASAEARVRGFAGSASSALSGVTSTVKNLFATFGVGLSFAAFEEYTRHVVLAAESLKNFSTVTGSSVEDLSRLSNAARISGVDFDTFKSMVQRLASTMQTVGAESTQAQKALQFLGISARDPAQALEEVALALEKYADGTGKAAIARDLFGRGGPEMVASLHAIATAERDLITTTTADAEAAAKLAEEIRRLGVHMTFFKDIILRDLVPALASFLDAMSASRAAGLGWIDSLMIARLRGELGPALVDLRAELAKLNDDLAGYQKYGFSTWAASAVADIDLVTKKIAALKDIQLRAAQALISPANMDARDLALKNINAKPVLDYAAAVKTAKDETAAFIKQLVEEYAKLTLTDAQYKEYQATLIGVADKTKGLREEIARLIEQKAQEKAALEVAKKLWEEQDKAIEDARKNYATYTASLIAGTAALQLELDTIGMTNIAAREYALAIQIKDAAERHDTDTVAELTKQMELLHQIAGKEGMVQAAKDAEAAWKQTAASIENDLVSAFQGMFTKGKDLFEQLKSFAMKLFEQLVLRPMLAPVAGGIASFLTPGAAGASGGGLNLGGLSSLFSGGGGGFGSLSEFSTGTVSMGGLGEFAGGAGMLATISPFIPYIGIALAAIPFLAGLFSSKPSEAQAQLAIKPGTGGFEEERFTSTQFGNIGFSDETTKYISGEVLQKVLVPVITGALDAFASRMTGEQQDRLADILQKMTFGAFEGTFTTEDFLQKFGGQILQQVVEAAFGVLDPALASVIHNFKGTGDEIAKFSNTLLAIYDASTTFSATFKANVVGALTDATQATADKVLAFVAIVNAAASAFSPLSAKLQTLSSADIPAFIDALGGAQAAIDKTTFLFNNFFTSSERTASATAQLNKDFTDLGIIQIPQTHAEFLTLLNSFDLTTEAGRGLYAGVLNLAGAFVQVHGTADAAAGAVDNLSGALSDAARSAQEFFNTNFYSDAEKQAKQYAADLKLVNDAQAALNVQIPRTIAGFRSLIEGIDTSTDAGKALYAALIILAPAIFNLAGAATQAAAAINAAASSIGVGLDVATTAAEKFVAKFTSMVNDLANASTGDLGAKLGIKIELFTDQIAKLQAKYEAQLIASGGFVDIVAVQLLEEIASLQSTNHKMIEQLALFTTLKAQYGAGIAEQLIQLTEWYDQQRKALGNNVAALTILQTIYEGKWTDIINGTNAGVTGTIAALQRIRDYLDSLKLGSLSVLSPQQKLTEASKQFADELALAQGGDATALNHITQSADAYLQLARQYFASGGQYTDIYTAVTQALQGLLPITSTDGFTDVAIPGSTTPTSTTTTSTPVSGKDGKALATSDDLQATNELIKKMISKLDSLSTAERAAIVGTSEESTTEIVKAVKDAATTIVGGSTAQKKR